jgi:predicted ATPase/class 3 adenylate cyclase
MSGMNCPACQHANRASAKFCEHCGARLPRECAACGTTLGPAARFCDECGQAVGDTPAARAPVASPADGGGSTSVAEVADRLSRQLRGYTPKHLADKILTSRSALEGERKLVTVLFADCVGFTEISTRLDPEELHGLMDGCFRHLLDAVHRYEGTVNQFTGDGIMALFGAPIAHEDHAVRAVSAALDVHRALAAYASALRQDSGIDLAVRIGVNTGPVVVGKIGDDLRMDYTAQGETVNLAARLQAAAPPGGVLVSDATHRLVAGYFEARDAGVLTLKGLATPVRAWAVTGQRRGRDRFDLAIERGLTPLVGRGRELAFLRDCLAQARGGRGQVVSIVGAAGVGKSRLAWELRRDAADESVTCLSGRCLPHGASLPYHLVVSFLQANFGIVDGEDERAQVERIERRVHRLDPALGWTIPYLRHLLALPAPELEAAGLDHPQQKRRLAEAVKALVLRGAERRPLFLLAEDLQWIDPSSEEFFRALVDGLATHPVLLLTTYRVEYAPPWRDRSFHHRVALHPLSAEEAGAMVESLFRGAEAPAGARELLVRRAEGNPLFVEELARYLRERAPGGGGELAERDVPATIHDLLTARIDRLPAPTKRMLQLASVLGREFSLPLLEEVAAPDDVKPALDELVALELVRQKGLGPEPSYAFGQGLIQQVAYEGLLLKTRGEIHARAGAALERLYADRLEEALPQLAEHYGRAPDRAKALEYLIRAGDRAMSLFAYDEAESCYGRALEAARATGDPRPGPVVDRLGNVALARGALADARACWEEALAATAAPGARAELHRKMGGACWAAGEKAGALQHLHDGLAALGSEHESIEAARLYEELARIHVRLGDHRPATDWASRALALGKALGAQDVVSHAHTTWGVAQARAGALEEGAASVLRGLETALAHRLLGAACRAYTNLAVIYASLDHERSVEYCRQGLALAQQIGDQLQQAWLYCTLAGGHCTLAGDYDEGVRAAESAAEIDERLGQRSHLPIPLIILAQIYQCRGDYERSAYYYRKALAVAEAMSEPQLLFPCYEGLATLAIESGDEAEATRWLARSREVQETTGWTSDAFLVLPFLC